MIADRIENAHLYVNLSPKIAKALHLLKDKGLAEKDNGRYDVDADDLFYIVDRYQTQPIETGRLEAHRKYVDIQFVAEGEELLGFAPLDNLEIDQAYDEAKDCAFYKVPEKISTLNLKAGMFCILFGADAHMPSRQLNGPSQVLKVVVKVRIDA